MRVKFGISLPILLDVTVQEQVQIAMAAERLGFDSVWMSDHVVIPGGQRGRFADNFYDPFATLAFIAAKTRSVVLGTSIVVLPYRNPIVLAKMATTLDHLSTGRLVLGVGAGWLREEFDALGVPFAERGRRTDEYLGVLKSLFTQESPEFEGEFFRFRDIVFEPKPLQRPHVPIIVGGNGDRAMERAVEYGDGWQPIWLGPEGLGPRIERVREALEAHGRGGASFEFSLRTRLRLGRAGGGDEQPGSIFTGSAEDISAQIEAVAALGVASVVLDILSATVPELLSTMEVLATEVFPRFR